MNEGKFVLKVQQLQTDSFHFFAQRHRFIPTASSNEMRMKILDKSGRLFINTHEGKSSQMNLEPLVERRLHLSVEPAEEIEEGKAAVVEITLIHIKEERSKIIGSLGLLIKNPEEVQRKNSLC